MTLTIPVHSCGTQLAIDTSPGDISKQEMELMLHGNHFFVGSNLGRVVSKDIQEFPRTVRKWHDSATGTMLED